MNDTANMKVNMSPGARAAVRLEFNPSSDDRVHRLKVLAAAFITECEAVRNEGIGAREVSIAITHMETAAMWAVKAATAGK